MRVGGAIVLDDGWMLPNADIGHRDGLVSGPIDARASGDQLALESEVI
jgi:hypothetical protein